MLSREAVEEQLRKIGFNSHGWGRSEVKELNRILMEDEVISECVNGEYSGGFAMLAATNHRILLIDKKPLLYLTVEDMRFDMINDFNYSHRLVNATITIASGSKTLVFTSWNKRRLRKLLECIQQRVIQMRQQQHIAQQFQQLQTFAQMAQQQQTQQSQFQPQPSYAPNMAQQTEIERTGITSNRGSNAAARFAATRATLGVYTRSKLPSFRHRSSEPEAQSGEVYQGYNTGPGLNGYQIPYEY